MAGIGEAASVVALIQISEKVFDLCRKYLTEVKDARKDIQRLRDEATSLQDVLVDLKDLVDSPNTTKLPVLDRLNQVDGPVQQCQEQLKELVSRLEPREGPNRMRKFGMRALKWPFSSKDVDKVIATIKRHKDNFNLALNMDLV